MTLHQLKEQLQQQTTLAFELPDGSLVPNHFHVTEVGKVTKHFHRLWWRDPKRRSCEPATVGG